MRITSRPLMLICIFSFLIMSQANAFQSGGKFGADKDERAILRNQYGAAVSDSNGQRVNYSREQLEAQEAEARAKEPPVKSPANVTPLLPAIEAAWNYSTLGSGIGMSNIIVAQNGASREIYASAGDNCYWVVLRYNSTTQDYDELYVSPYFRFLIRRIKVADVIGDSAKEIIVALQNGQIYLYDQASRALISTMTTAVNGLAAMDVADLEGDGTNELVLCNNSHLYVYSGNGVLKWDVNAVGGNDLVVGQMDTDSALEIAFTDGNVIDGATHSSQWKRAQGFGVHLAASDIDSDGMKELIVAEGWQFVFAYDVERQLPKWTISTPQDIGAIQVVDIDNDSVQELLVGDGQWGDVKAYSTVTQQQEWFVHNPEHGVTNIAVGDADGDGTTDLLWGAGATSSGQDHLYVANWQTGQIKWQNIHLDGPFIGPEVGDLDGDGNNEIVAISNQSNSGYSSGRILVFDATTRRLRAISDPTMLGLGWTGIHDLKLRDVNRDGKMEILVAASDTYDGLIEIYTFDSSNHFALIWDNNTLPFGAPFYSVDAADIDGDGDIEIVGGVSSAHSGTQGIFIYVYNYNTGNEEWHSLHMGWGAVNALALADVDQDGATDIIGMINDQDIYIFDGTSKVLKKILTGPFTSMRVRNIGGLPTIVAGNENGQLIMHRYSSGSYNEVYRQTLITTPVDGFSFDPQGRVWIGSRDDNNFNGTLTQVTLAGTTLATYSGYGLTLGMRVAFVPGSPLFFTTGSYSVLGFPASTAFTKIGIYSSSERTFYLRNSNSAGFADFNIQYGPAGAIPIVGDWDGNLTATIGVYDPANQTFYLRNSNTPGFADLTIRYGPPGAIPLAGDWDGNGTVTIGVYDPSNQTFYLRNSNTPGFADLTIRYGPAGATPVVGDWNGDGTATIGVYDASNQTFYLRNTNSLGFADLTIRYGPSSATPVVGDWDGNGTATIGVYDPSNQTFYLRNSNSPGFADLTFRYGPSGAAPVAGNWNGL